MRLKYISTVLDRIIDCLKIRMARSMGVVLTFGLLNYTSAFAVTECNVTPTSIYSGGGTFWVVFSNGGAAFMPVSDSTYSVSYALAMTAYVTGKHSTVRFQADGAACTVNGQQFIGIWISG